MLLSDNYQMIETCFLIVSSVELLILSPIQTSAKMSDNDDIMLTDDDDNEFNESDEKVEVNITKLKGIKVTFK